MLVNYLHCTAASERLKTTTDDSTINFFHFLIFNVKSSWEHLDWLTCFIVLVYIICYFFFILFCCCTDVLDQLLLLLCFFFLTSLFLVFKLF